jgi:hypothetical protein
MQLKAAQILCAGGIGRPADKSRKLANGSNVCGLRLGRQLAQPHVLDHALT